MTKGGFDDVEIKNRNREEEEEEEEEKENEKEKEEETSFGGDDHEDHNRSTNIINIENPKRKFNRVDLSRQTSEYIKKNEKCKSNNYSS